MHNTYITGPGCWYCCLILWFAESRQTTLWLLMVDTARNMCCIYDDWRYAAACMLYLWWLKIRYWLYALSTMTEDTLRVVCFIYDDWRYAAGCMLYLRWLKILCEFHALSTMTEVTLLVVCSIYDDWSYPTGCTFYYKNLMLLVWKIKAKY